MRDLPPCSNPIRVPKVLVVGIGRRLPLFVGKIISDSQALVYFASALFPGQQWLWGIKIDIVRLMCIARVVLVIVVIYKVPKSAVCCRRHVSVYSTLCLCFVLSVGVVPCPVILCLWPFGWSRRPLVQQRRILVQQVIERMQQRRLFVTELSGNGIEEIICCWLVVCPLAIVGIPRLFPRALLSILLDTRGCNSTTNSNCGYRASNYFVFVLTP